MYLNSQSYEKKYKKYKNKYQILKSNIGGTKGTLLPSINGGDCDPLPNTEEDDIISGENLLDLCPDERITIQNKCYEVKALYQWIIERNNIRLPDTQIIITEEEKKRLIQVYKALPKPNILTRDKLIQLYPNLQQETSIVLIRKGYTDIALGTFSNLPNLKNLNLEYNKIQELPPGIFDNLPNLGHLYLNHNQIRELQPNIFYNLPRLSHLILNNNQIQELQPNIFNNLPALVYLYLYNNQIQELQQGTFDNSLQRLHVLDLSVNQIRELQPGIFNNLLNLEYLSLHDNQIRELQPGTFNIPSLWRLRLSNNLIQELHPGTFNNLPKLFNLDLENNQISELQHKSYYGLHPRVQIII